MANETYMPSGDLEIASSDRIWFLNDLGKQYSEAPIRILTEGPIGGEARDCHLHHIQVEVDEIIFHMKCDNSDNTRYAVANPLRLIAHRRDNGITESLTIPSLDGSVTRVWLGDAVAASEDVAA